DRPFEKWRYAALRPVYRSFGLGLGFHYSRYHDHYHHHHHPGFYYETGPDYVPVTVAVVRFENGRVTYWETGAAPYPPAGRRGRLTAIAGGGSRGTCRRRSARTPPRPPDRPTANAPPGSRRSCRRRPRGRIAAGRSC